MEDARSQLHYYRLTADNRILMGGGNIAPILGHKLDYDSNKKVFEYLEQHVINVFPQLSGLRFTHHWGGPVWLAIDTVPIIGYQVAKNARSFHSV